MKRLKPRPGSLPLPKADASERTDFAPPTVPFWQKGLPPWLKEEDEKSRLAREEKARDRVFTALGAARKKAEELAGEVRSEGFNDWIRRCLKPATRPSEWTQARALYESYLAHARTYGRNRSQKALSVQELATETQWGRMMATQFPNKKRKTAGWFYPLTVKRGG